jgi:hypothetical protein
MSIRCFPTTLTLKYEVNIWISEFCLKDDEKGFMGLSEVKSRIRGIPNILDIHIKYREKLRNPY